MHKTTPKPVSDSAVLCTVHMFAYAVVLCDVLVRFLQIEYALNVSGHWLVFLSNKTQGCFKTMMKTESLAVL